MHAVTSWSCRVVLLLLGIAGTPALAQQFPFDQEMLLEGKRLPGVRRVPMIEVQSDGKASIDFWCHAARADVAVSGAGITFTFTSAQPQDCTPERIALDQQLAKTFQEIVSWSRSDDVVTFTGPTTTLRFRLSAH